eukprot:1159505-Pelagomonas_calceolata.AAC.5
MSSSSLRLAAAAPIWKELDPQAGEWISKEVPGYPRSMQLLMLVRVRAELPMEWQLDLLLTGTYCVISCMQSFDVASRSSLSPAGMKQRLQAVSHGGKRKRATWLLTAPCSPGRTSLPCVPAAVDCWRNCPSARTCCPSPSLTYLCANRGLSCTPVCTYGSIDLFNVNLHAHEGITYSCVSMH